MRRESRFSLIPHLANVTDSGVIGPGPQMTQAQARHAAVWEQAFGEVRAGQEGAEGGTDLLHHLDPEPNPLALLLHDLVDAHDQPPVRCGKLEGGQVILWPVPGPIL